MQLTRGLAALSHRDYRLYFFGQLVSISGSTMQTIGLSWITLQLTGSAFKLGVVSALQYLPTLLFGAFGGALADRWPKRQTILATQTALMLLAFVLAALAWTGRVQLWHLALLSLLLGLCSTVDDPARQAFLVDMVDGTVDLGNAIALNSGLNSGARLIGPAVAGLLIARYDVGLTFFLNGVSFLAVIAALLAIRAAGKPKHRGQKALLKETLEGFRYVRRTPSVFLVLAILGVIALFVINFSQLTSVLAKDVLKRGATGFGYLMTARGAGAMIGAALLTLRPKGREGIASIGATAVGYCTIMIGIFFVHTFWLAAVGLFLTGVAQTLFTADTNTYLLEASPEELRGRVAALYFLMYGGVVPFGALFTGAVIDWWNGSVGFLAAGSVGLVLTLGLLGWWRAAGARQGAIGAGAHVRGGQVRSGQVRIG